MNYNANEDKIDNCYSGVSYNQVEDVVNGQTDYADIVSLAELKLYMKVDNSDDNATIDQIAFAAVAMCENYVGINFAERQVTATINNYNGGAYLPYGPVVSITSVSDIDGNIIAATGYKLLGSAFKKVLWPLQQLVIVYQGGYTAGNCPASFINAVKAQTLFLYENRGDSQIGMSPIAEMILNPLRRT